MLPCGGVCAVWLISPSLSPSRVAVGPTAVSRRFCHAPPSAMCAGPVSLPRSRLRLGFCARSKLGSCGRAAFRKPEDATRKSERVGPYTCTKEHPLYTRNLRRLCVRAPPTPDAHHLIVVVVVALAHIVRLDHTLGDEVIDKLLNQRGVDALHNVQVLAVLVKEEARS